MLKKPQNYEEARVIIENSIDDDYFKRKFRIEKLKSLFLTGLAVSIATAIGYTTGDKSLGYLSYPFLQSVVLPFIVPYFMLAATKREIKSGAYFSKYEKGDIWDAADKYVDGYNKYQQKQENKYEKKRMLDELNKNDSNENIEMGKNK